MDQRVPVYRAESGFGFPPDAVSPVQSYRKGSRIVTEGQSADFLACISSGVVKLCKDLPDGRRQIVCLLFPSDILGNACDRQFLCTAEAATDVELRVVPGRVAHQLIENDPDLRERLLKDALDRVDSARDWMMVLGRMTAREKVAYFLLMLAAQTAYVKNSEADPEIASVIVPLTRADIADCLGLTIETVSRQLSLLNRANIIQLETQIRINIGDIDRLALTAASH